MIPQEIAQTLIAACHTAIGECPSESSEKEYEQALTWVEANS